ncbi:hypothetical protein MCOR25_008248 [Pyricularia grisea]|uniref:Uncharacterized protein n=1 Tax=Pyricularia grisea TaxID=148305 RepID=A0A6P8BL15_PYRGI|nr:uncharacterized protein PgNI_00497 [Pyricularia grisea]KAI6355314.1 hypothetical protein MCOR25_008248 [Pyricularia grisea]TLD17384.1 hypothetical protein PgNI_00497 [Pyricularia grisea]
MSAKPTSDASKATQIKAPVPGRPVFGCEHVQLIMTQNRDLQQTSISHYKAILRCIFENPPVIPETSITASGQNVTSLTSNYLCLQCPQILGVEERLEHGNKKSHRFYVDSRNGMLYCQMCDDYVWDPTLEELRLRKIGAGTFTLRKRKRDELSPEAAKEEARYIALNTNQVPCKATGLRGIYNAGATCYQNVILQSFLHNPFLRNYYLSDGHQSGECQTQYCMSCAMDDIFQDFYSQETTNGYTAANMLCGFWSLERKAFANLVTTKEQDAHEFFQLLAEELHERNGDGKRPESGSEHLCDCIIHQTYYGKLQSNTTCQGCGSVTNQVQSFLDLSLGLDSTQKKKKLAGTKSEGGSKGASLSLQDCLEEEYVKSDKCEYRCNKCNSTQQARRNTSLKRLPNVLSIQLKRFEYKQGRHDKAVKVDTPVKFPLQLNMFPYTDRGPSTESKENYELARTCQYDLFSVVEHVGEIDTGHYTCYCKVQDQWFAFNDHKVEMASVSQVLSAKAYLLFYIVSKQWSPASWGQERF